MHHEGLDGPRLPYEIECAGNRIQFRSCGRELMILFVQDPGDQGELIARLSLTNAARSREVLPHGYAAYRLSYAAFKEVQLRIHSLGFEVVHWHRPTA